MSDWPDGFIWGTGASSTQTEGASPGSDWYAWEEAGRAPRSGDGNGFATRYAEDFALYAEHGLTHHRLSLDWNRLEPKQGQHPEEEVERYRAILQAGRDAGLSIWVCLHHFTLPGWFADDLHGFRDDRQGRLLWSRHVDWVGETFGDLVAGLEADQRADLLRHRRPPARRHPARSPGSHRGRPRARHDAPGRRRRRPPPAHAGHTDGHGGGLAPGVHGGGHRRESAAAVAQMESIWWDSWASDEQLDHYDYLGFSYYSAHRRARRRLVRSVAGGRHARARRATCAGPRASPTCSTASSADHPDRPILISEAGIGTDDDQQRNDYVEAVLDIARDAITGGVDLRGIFWWTGVDNYEWGQGFDVRFGLFDRDRNPKPAAEIAKRQRRVTTICVDFVRRSDAERDTDLGL